jgi:hypothetical protein
VADVNQAMYDFGMAMGPLAMSDLADWMWAGGFARNSGT